MSDPTAGSSDATGVASTLATLRQALAGTYSYSHVRDMLPRARRFLEYLSARDLPIQQVQTGDVAEYLRTAPRRRLNRRVWDQRQTTAINHLLRVAAPDAPHVADPNLAHPIVAPYLRWLRDVAGLSAATVRANCAAARRFLRWCSGRELAVESLTVEDLDAYVASWPATLRRSSRAQLIGSLRAFLRYLAAENVVPRKLLLALKRPIVYAMESVPAALDASQVAQVCSAAGRDTTPQGRRDNAILLMLAAYGCRPGELAALRLEHINWRNDTIALPRPKTRTSTSLPLLPKVGAALVDYLRNGRPPSSTREVFLRVQRPFTAFARGSTVSQIVRRRLIAAGLEVPRRCGGAYGFRHQTALDLLRAGYPRAVVGDVLGHRHERSTQWYLKLPTEDLRDVCLPLPRAVRRPRGPHVIYPVYRRWRLDLDPACPPQRHGYAPGTLPLSRIGGAGLEALISRYVRERRGWAPGTRVSVHSVLRCYCRFALKCDAGTPFSLPVLLAWLASLAERSPLGLVSRRAHNVDHFLDWWAAREGRRNPFDELDTTMGESPLVRVIAAVVRPGLRPLEALRPRPRFRSHLAGTIVGHIQRMRSLGCKYDEQHYRAFDAFVCSYPGANERDFDELAQAFVSAAASPSQRLRRTSTVRAIANALSRSGCQARPLAWDPHVARAAQTSRRRPVIVSEGNVRQFLGACERLASPLAPLRPSTLKAMGALAYCAGLRLGELVRLRVRDLDLRSGTLDVLETKFFKSRRLPLHSSVTALLRAYLAKRRAAGAPSDPEAPLFWSEVRRAGHTLSGAEEPLSLCLAAVGLRTGDRRDWTRPHDLRHTFVVHRLTRWYRKGINPQDHLAYLATYLGHRDINSTLVYITVTRELLQQACLRLRPLLARPLVAGPKE